VAARRIGGDRAVEGGDRTGKLLEHAEAELGEAAEIAAHVESAERVLRRRAQLEGREYVRTFAAAPARTPLLEENELAWELFSACQTQVNVAGFGVVVGVSHETLDSKMVRRGVTDPDAQLELEEKFRLIEAVFVKHCRRSTEAATGKGE
jgi:transcription elongation GreA/GreB family factor